MKIDQKQDFYPQLYSVLRQGYSFSDLRADIIAGLTVAVVALPLAMALGIASGASPEKGLITAVVAGFIISILGGSRVQIGGPTGAFVVVIFNVIAQYGYDGLVLATMMAGVILVIAGYARFGKVIKYIPLSVVTGFTTGIAIIIASTQVKDFLGLSIDSVPADFIPKWAAYFEGFGSVHMQTCVLAFASLVFIIGLRKWFPNLPAFLIAVVLASLLAAGFNLDVATIGSRFPDIPSGLPWPELPSFSYAKIQEIFPSALTIAFLAGIEALLSAVVADGMTGYRHRSSQELVAQGFANIVSSLFGGMPATGAIARTATNIKAGGRSPISGIMHALFLLAFVLFATSYMKFVPMAVLAAVLFMVAWGMSEIHNFISILKVGGNDRIILLLTFLLTVLVDLTVGIGVGVILASLLFMANMSESVEISTAKEDVHEEDQRHDLPEEIEVFRITGPLFFGMATELMDTLGRVGVMPQVLILRMRYVPFLDASGAAAIEDLIERCEVIGTRVIISSVQKQPEKLLAKHGFGAHFLESKEKQRVLYAANYTKAVEAAKGLICVPEK